MSAPYKLDSVCVRTWTPTLCSLGDFGTEGLQYEPLGFRALGFRKASRGKLSHRTLHQQSDTVTHGHLFVLQCWMTGAYSHICNPGCCLQSAEPHPHLSLSSVKVTIPRSGAHPPLDLRLLLCSASLRPCVLWVILALSLSCKFCISGLFRSRSKPSMFNTKSMQHSPSAASSKRTYYKGLNN